MSGEQDTPAAARSLLPAPRLAGADRAWWFGRSSKPRWRRLRRLRWVRFPHAPATFLALLIARPLLGQIPDSTAPRSPLPAPRAAAVDTVHGLKPLPAFFHSLVIPGWAQSKLDRKLTAGLFVMWEGVSLGMTLKAAGEVRYLRRIGADSVRINGKKAERQDWLVMLGFNHLFSGLEAYVSAHLQDFPTDVKFRPAPSGIGMQAIVPFRIP